MKLYLKHQTGQALILVVIILVAIGVIFFLVRTQGIKPSNSTPQPTAVLDEEDESSDLLDKDGDGIDDDEQADY